MKRKLLFIASFVFNCFVSSAQDSLRVMTLNDFYGLIMANHPVAKQAATFSDAAKNEIRIARGNFDPQLKAGFDQKRYDTKDYWQVWEGALNVPVWFGTDLKIGYAKADGLYLDKGEILPDEGLTSIGISVPLGQGLLIDQRRATLKQARLLSTLAEAERIKQINYLLLAANKDYFDWLFLYSRLELHQEALRLAQVRFEGIRDRVLLGDLPAIDSTEALVEVDNRTNIYNQSLLEYQNEQFIISNYLWNNNGEPVVIANNVVPQLDKDPVIISPAELQSLIDSANVNHPELIKLNVKISQLEIERRWAAEKLRPKLNLDYNFLSRGTDNYDQFSPLFDDDFKFGVNFSMPLFLRAERGKYSLSKLKVLQTEFERDQAQREIINRIRQAYNEVQNSTEQIVVQNRQLTNANRMLEAEVARFFNGEGSVFLVNTREIAVINSRIKLVELETKLRKSKAFLSWSAGRLIY